MGNNTFSSSKEFDARFRYDGKDLGASCTENQTIFKVWSPLAEKIELCLYKDSNAKACLKKEMQPDGNGVWKQEFNESLHGTYYDYIVRIAGEDTRTADPYAVGCGCNGERSMVVNLNLTNPPGFASDTAPKVENEQIIYELHIKDFSYDTDSGIPEEYRGKYKAFTVRGMNGSTIGATTH